MTLPRHLSFCAITTVVVAVHFRSAIKVASMSSLSGTRPVPLQCLHLHRISGVGSWLDLVTADYIQ